MYYIPTGDLAFFSIDFMTREQVEVGFLGLCIQMCIFFFFSNIYSYFKRWFIKVL